jgi:cytolysin-activating lysine-acyltransferase
MPDNGKSARGAKRGAKAGSPGKQADTPSPGAAALKEALAELAMSPPGPAAAHGTSGANGNPAAAGQPQGQPRSPGKTVSQVLGEITWLMTQSPRHKAIPLGDLEWLVMPAILLRQFRIFYRGEQPVGVALWALADDLVAKRIDAGDRRLAAVEWKSGSRLRIVDIVAPFGGESEMRAQVGA